MISIFYFNIIILVVNIMINVYNINKIFIIINYFKNINYYIKNILLLFITQPNMYMI